jgi:hypothetical protein
MSPRIVGLRNDKDNRGPLTSENVVSADRPYLRSLERKGIPYALVRETDHTARVSRNPETIAKQKRKARKPDHGSSKIEDMLRERGIG